MKYTAMLYETVMGLEVHVELATESKLFCGCSAKFGADANESALLMAWEVAQENCIIGKE